MSHRKDTDYLSISTRVRAMENRLLTRERMDRMIEARDDAEARKVMSECGYSDSLGLEQALMQARAEVFADLAKAVPDPGSGRFGHGACPAGSEQQLLPGVFS